jgi:hypothetical protein
MSQEKCNISAFKILLIFNFVLLSGGVTFGQQASLSGRILDQNTQQPVPFATVFLASTTFGVSAAENGQYHIQNIPKGKYDVIVSCVGYENAFASLEFVAGLREYTFYLTPKALQLKEVIVDGAQNPKHFQLFLKFFLGTTPNARHCEIENPEGIYLSYDKEKKVLTAETIEPLVITNRALGYRIHYLLDEFTLDEKGGTFRVFGIPRFEDLPFKNAREQRKWIQARNQAYSGSLNHFIRSLVKREVRKNKFSMQTLPKHTPINPDSLFKSDNLYVLNFSGKLEIVYEGEKEKREFRMIVTPPGMNTLPRPVQTSIISFTAQSLLLYDNGYFEDQKTLILDGYLAWSESIAELVPLGYEPIEK